MWRKGLNRKGKDMFMKDNISRYKNRMSSKIKQFITFDDEGVAKKNAFSGSRGEHRPVLSNSGSKS